MGEGDIAKAIAEARSYLTTNPAEARYRDGGAPASVEGGLRVRVVGPDGATLVTDMVTGIGGGGSAPSPAWMFRAGYASCVATLIAMRAAEDGFSIEGLQVSVDSESDDQGILGISAEVPAGPLSMRVVVRSPTRTDGGDLGRIRAAIEAAVARCPVHDAVVRAVPVEVVIEMA
jgi:uncharacterized OsmC-like protein